MSVEQNKALVRRYFEGAPKQPEVYDESLAANFQVPAIHHATINVDTKERGPEPPKRFATWLQTLWGDNRGSVDELIADGDRVMAR